MTTQQLDPNEVIADVESYLADSPAALGFEEQVQIAALVLEVAAHVKMLQSSAAIKGNAATACYFLDLAATNLLDILNNDQVAEQARAMVHALPAGGRKQAVIAYLGGG